MNLKRMLRVSSIAAGIGVAGVFGTTIATANAAPATCTSSPQACAVGSKQVGPTVKLDHHQQKEVGKQAKKEAKGKQMVTPRAPATSTEHFAGTTPTSAEAGHPYGGPPLLC